MKKLILLTLVVVLTGIGASAHAALRLAYVDIAKVFDKYNGTEVAKAKLKKEAETQKGKLEKDQDKLKHKLEDLQAKKKALTDEKYKQQEEAIMGEIRTLQGQIQVVQSGLVNQEKEMTSQILDEIREVVKNVADKEKWDYVFEQNALLFGGTEITATVLKQLNSK
ncbi:MAG: OmpH family outer membrane protein [candidate division FCPU426 bacterium]